MEKVTEANTNSRKRDRWADWLVSARERGMSKTQIRRFKSYLNRVRNRVLKNAKLRKGHNVLDVGAGTGLLALEASKRVGPTGYVIATDISADALDECLRQSKHQAESAAIGAVVGDVLHLPFADEAFDAVVIRSVLIYVSDKQQGIQELHRVVCPSGWVSVFEPINEVSEAAMQRWPLELGEEQETYERIFNRAYRAPSTSTLGGFDERDLLEWFITAGFKKVEVSYEHSYETGPPPKKQDVISRLLMRPNPNALSYEEAARELLGDDADRHLERVVELSLQPRTGASANCYITAQR